MAILPLPRQGGAMYLERSSSAVVYASIFLGCNSIVRSARVLCMYAILSSGRRVYVLLPITANALALPCVRNLSACCPLLC
jgi:hypothetical protein